MNQLHRAWVQRRRFLPTQPPAHVKPPIDVTVFDTYRHRQLWVVVYALPTGELFQQRYCVGQ